MVANQTWEWLSATRKAGQASRRRGDALSPSRLRCLLAIIILTHQAHTPPTYRELAARLQVSHTYVARIVEWLQWKGYLRQPPRKGLQQVAVPTYRLLLA